MRDAQSQAGDEWWRTAVVYQVYLRSFADGNGDGVGDIAGLVNRLPYLASLGVDALWINPWYPSPQADGGYDVADYRDIDPDYGTLRQAEELIEAIHGAGLRVLLDIVPNHTSDQHPWFQAALSGDQAARARYLFRPGRGGGGELPPNDWTSTFGGPAWTRVVDGDGLPGQWYLHLFAPEQPDLNWSNPEVRSEFEDVLRFWFDRDVDGFRIDVAHGLSKTPGLPDHGSDDPEPWGAGSHPAWDQDEVHEVYRSWRRIADGYDSPRVFVAEAWVSSNERLARYVRPDELNSAFQFDFLLAPFDADEMGEIADRALTTAQEVKAPATWVLSNHDVVRQVTRYAQPDQSRFEDGPWEPSLDADSATSLDDLDVGRRRARAALLVVLALPGTAYLYQGEELGLPEVEDIAPDRRRDPIWEQSGHRHPGRDGCRIPLPWEGLEPPYGFSPPDFQGQTWLPQPPEWAALAVAAQSSDATSVLSLYRDALRIRRECWRDAQPVSWLDSPRQTLAFRRGNLECWLNTGKSAVELPGGHLLVASVADPRAGQLPPDTAVWIDTDRREP